MAAPESGYLLPSLILAIIFSISTTINPIFSEDSGSWEFSSGNSGLDSGQVLGFQDGATKSTFAVGLEHLCWISIDDSVYCQGSNYYSQLGIVGVSVKSNKIDLGEFGKPEILSSGEFHTCSITERSIVGCWGFDTYGQSSGNPGAGEYAVGPTNIDLGGLAAVAISSGKYHSCALTVGGGVFCWGTFGGSVPGESGNFEGFPEEIIDGITSHAISISSGDHHACSLIINRSVKCWGDNKYQQLGSDNYGEFFNSPVLVTNHSRVMAISLNGDSSCSLKLSGELECWGRGIGGIGSGEEIDYSVQNIEHSVINPLVISSGGGSVCLIGDLGETGCWGAMGEVAIPAIRPSIAISEKQYCYVAIEKSALECSALQHSSSQPIDVGEVRLNDMDLDLDGVLDHMDDFPRDPGRSVICQPGEFGRHYCEKAPPGFFVKNANSQNPEPCPVGTFQSEYGKDHCLVSPPGSYVDSPASALPTYCPPGTFSAEVGQIFQDCVEAEPGNWAPGGTGIQLSCPAGSFQPEGGRENCILAGPGRFSVNESSTFDIPCQIGAFQPLEGQSGCTVSDSGHYVDQVGSQSQTPCPRGTYNPKIGSTSPDDCYPVSPGNFSLEGSAEPIECPPGTFQPDWGRGSCLESTPGFFVGSPGADSQTPCEPGKYQPNHSQTECMEAIPGYYTNKAGAAEITPCPVGTFQNESGSSACIYSSRGFFVDSPGSANQEHCPAGKYSSVEGAISRSICATVQAGYYSLNGSSSATPCPVGTFQPETGQPSCLNATVGFFVDDIGSIQQEKCPENSTTIGASAVSTEDCVTPMPGFYITNSGFAPCPKGTYQPLPAQHFCINATAGHFVDHIGSNAQTPCPAGTFSDADVSTSSEVCQTAPVGSFAPGGEAEARIAEPGYYVDLQGSESQTPCPDGTFSEVTGATSYEACQIVQPGEFSESGSSEAIPCPIGTFQPYEGQSECIEASPGHYSEIMGSIAQLPCTIGYFQPNS